MKTKLLYRLLSLLGFSAVLAGCDSNPYIEPAEYGSPWAEYEFKGKVTDKDGEPVKGIRVVYKYPSLPYGNGSRHDIFKPDTVYTNSQGEYLISDGNHERIIGIIQMRAEETEEVIEQTGGTYITTIQNLNLTADDYKNAGKWYEGKVYKEIDFLLQPKPQPDPEE